MQLEWISKRKQIKEEDVEGRCITMNSLFYAIIRVTGGEKKHAKTNHPKVSRVTAVYDYTTLLSQRNA